MRSALFLITLLIATSASANDNRFNNQMIKDCLSLYDYAYENPDPQTRLNNFNWQAASDCVAGFRYAEHLERKASIQKFLNENPWFRGKNWKWQERAEYTCRQVTTLNGSYEVCSKPIYLN